MFQGFNINLHCTENKAVYSASIPPEQPVLVLVTKNQNSGNLIQLDWQDDANADSYDIYHKLSSSGTWTLDAAGYFLSGYVFSPLIAGEDYDFRVVANGTSETSEGFLYNETAVADAPTLTVSNVAQTTLDLNWSAMLGADDYYLQYKETSSGTWLELSTFISATTLNVTGLAADTSYDFRALSRTDGYIGQYGSVTTQQTLNNPPDQVTAANLAFVPSTESVSCSWTGVARATSYDLEWRISPSGGITTITGVTSAYNLTGLDDETTYDVRINAVNNGGTTVGEWDTVTTQQSVPTAPTNIQISQVTTSSMRVGWDASLEEPDSYNVWRKEGTGSYAEVATGVTDLFYDNTGLSPNTNYEFYIVAVNEAGQSTNSATNSGTTNPLAPSAPINLVASNIAKNQLVLNWDSGGGVVDRYEVEYKLTSEPTTWTVWDTNVTATNDTITGLTTETSYDFRVRAVNTTGSATSGVYTVSTLGTTTIRPVGDSVTDSAWTATPYYTKVNDQNDATFIVGDGGNGTCRIWFDQVTQQITGATGYVRVRQGANNNAGTITVEFLEANNVPSYGSTSFATDAHSTWTDVAIPLGTINQFDHIHVTLSRSGGGNPNGRQSIEVAEIWIEY